MRKLALVLRAIALISNELSTDLEAEPVRITRWTGVGARSQHFSRSQSNSYDLYYKGAQQIKTW